MIIIKVNETCVIIIVKTDLNYLLKNYNRSFQWRRYKEYRVNKNTIGCGKT